VRLKLFSILTLLLIFTSSACLDFGAGNKRKSSYGSFAQEMDPTVSLSSKSFRGETICQLLEKEPGKSLRSPSSCSSVFSSSGICDDGSIKAQIQGTSLVYEGTSKVVSIPQELLDSAYRLVNLNNITDLRISKIELLDYIEGMCNMSVDFNKKSDKDYASLPLIGSEAMWNKMVFSAYGLTSDLRKLKAFMSMTALIDSNIVKSSNQQNSKIDFGLRESLFPNSNIQNYTIYYVKTSTSF
jgi:hypothetical protein